MEIKKIGIRMGTSQYLLSVDKLATEPAATAQ
jgi:hypothetical protein